MTCQLKTVRATILGMIILKEAMFAIAFAVVTVAVAEYILWAANQ
jgi:hypothetical protein